MKLYIAGPMTGIAQFNIPAFNAAAEDLRAQGYEVVSPAELDSDEIRDFCLASEDGVWPADDKIGGETFGDILARDVKVISDEVDGIAALPGWVRSKGAKLEIFVNCLLNKPLYLYYAGELRPIDRHMALTLIMQDILRGE